ncbi:MAG TPA: pyridoxal phosphate-dependent aminotransferase family protein [Chryseosolibacter sp.]|nr:pyridoxal phosphate-dependent aminotransferase family protein [Chryseosolibacter sp.]
MKPDLTTLHGMQLMARNQRLSSRLERFNESMLSLAHTYLRPVMSAADREVIVEDHLCGGMRRMLMFASNNYLGLANHPHVQRCVEKAIVEQGCGIGGPPLLNGYTKIIRELEEKLAAFKNEEAAMVFSSGFMANQGLMSALAGKNDVILFDELSHASFYEGIRATKARVQPFDHNDIDKLELLLNLYAPHTRGTIFVCVEGVYSMNGDLAPLDRIAALCKKFSATLIVDDAHGTGVLGDNGRGTAFHFKCSEEVDVTMGTFSKVFATCGGFITGSRDLIQYLRYYARTYMFSASIPPPVAATVLGGLDVLEREPWLRLALLANVRYAVGRLSHLEFCVSPGAAIISIKPPDGLDIKKAALELHRRNIFINAIEYPAVPMSESRFRISIMATHTRDDINRLVEAIDEVWALANTNLL